MISKILGFTKIASSFMTQAATKVSNGKAGKLFGIGNILNLATKLTGSKFLKNMAKLAPIPGGWGCFGPTGKLSPLKLSGLISNLSKLGKKGHKAAAMLNLVKSVAENIQLANQNKAKAVVTK
jgi:hypothetical protein